MPEDVNSSTQPRHLIKNHILNALPDEDFERMRPNLEKVKLGHGDIIYRHDETIRYVYFPNDSMASVIATTPEGQLAEVGVVGREGMIGIDALLGFDTSFNQTIIQLSNGGYRMKVEAVRDEFNRCGALQKLLLRFARLMMIQISQTALCNRLHTVEERLARWLLLCHDRAINDEIKLTQEFLAIMLGTNRATVTTAALTLQGGGFIKYQRGKITMIDREGLQHFACDCYRTVKAEYDRVQN